MKLVMIVAVLLFCSGNAMACREGYGSSWSKAESVMVAECKWISIVEVEKIELQLGKSTYFYKVLRNLKGTGPENTEMKIGPFPQEFSDVDKSRPTWKDKGCRQHVFLEKGKQYILFSNIENTDSIQVFNQENESRILEKLRSVK